MKNLISISTFFMILISIIVISCDSSKRATDKDKIAVNDKIVEDELDGHGVVQTHTHSPCDRTTNSRTASNVSVSNTKAQVKSRNHLMFGQDIKIIVTPPDCRTTGVTIEPRTSYEARVMGFAMLQQVDGIWVTTPPEYVAFAPK